MCLRRKGGNWCIPYVSTRLACARHNPMQMSCGSWFRPYSIHEMEGKHYGESHTRPIYSRQLGESPTYTIWILTYSIHKSTRNLWQRSPSLKLLPEKPPKIPVAINPPLSPSQVDSNAAPWAPIYEVKKGTAKKSSKYLRAKSASRLITRSRYMICASTATSPAAANRTAWMVDNALAV